MRKPAAPSSGCPRPRSRRHIRPRPPKPGAVERDWKFISCPCGHQIDMP
jgi:hypothetical protein